MPNNPPSTENLTFHTLAELQAMDLEALNALWELVPTDRQRQYRDVLLAEVRRQAAAGSDQLEQQVVRLLLERYAAEALVPVGARWAMAPKRIQEAVQAGEALDTPEEKAMKTAARSTTPLWWMGAAALAFVCLMVFLLVGQGGGDEKSDSQPEVNGVAASPTLRHTLTPTPIALVESDAVIREGDIDRSLSYPISLQLMVNGMGDQQPRVFVIQRRVVELSEWPYDQNPDTASFLSDLTVPFVIGIPYSDENAVLFESLSTASILVLRQNTGGELRFALQDKREVLRSDTSAFRQLGPGLTLVLIGEQDTEGLPTGTRTVIMAHYLPEQELSRDGVLVAGEYLPTAAPAPTFIPTQTPLPANPRELLHVELIQVQTMPSLIHMRLRIYNNQAVPVTLKPEDFRLALGYAPQPPGPWVNASAFMPTRLLPGQALDLDIWWARQGEPYGLLAVLSYRFALEF